MPRVSSRAIERRAELSPSRRRSHAAPTTASAATRKPAPVTSSKSASAATSRTSTRQTKSLKCVRLEDAQRHLARRTAIRATAPAGPNAAETDFAAAPSRCDGRTLLQRHHHPRQPVDCAARRAGSTRPAVGAPASPASTNRLLLWIRPTTSTPSHPGQAAEQQPGLLRNSAVAVECRAQLEQDLHRGADQSNSDRRKHGSRRPIS